jgi:hypothetical protein
MRERAGLEAEAIEDIGETGKIRTPRGGRGSAGRDSGRGGSGRGSSGRGGSGRGGSGQPRKSTRDASDGSVKAGGEAARSRRRRRTRAGRELGGEQSAQRSADGAAPRLSGRRQASAQGENRTEETRRKAS